MRAIVFTRYGSPGVLELREVPKPIPADEEVLIRVHAASLNDWDFQALQGVPFVNRLMFGLLRPKKQILGSDICGRVEAVGRRVQKLRPGDEVFGDLSGRWGGLAEYVCAREDALALKAPGMTFEQAAAIPQAGLLALQSLRLLGPFREGQRFLINGAGGGVGTFAIQMVRPHRVEITGVDRPEKFEMLGAMGVQHFIDYTREDFTRNGQQYDRILDVKTNRSIFAYARALALNGTYVTVGGSMARLLQFVFLRPWISMTRKKNIRFLALKLNDGLTEMRDLFEAGKVVPVIDGSWELSEVPEAFRHFGAGRHKGKIVVTVKSG